MSIKFALFSVAAVALAISGGVVIGKSMKPAAPIQIASIDECTEVFVDAMRTLPSAFYRKNPGKIAWMLPTVIRDEACQRPRDRRFYTWVKSLTPTQLAIEIGKVSPGLK